MLACVLLTAGLVMYVMKRARPVYLLDYHVYKPADALKMPHAVFLKHTREAQVLNPRVTRFAASMQHHLAICVACLRSFACAPGLHAGQRGLPGEDGGQGRPGQRDVPACWCGTGRRLVLPACFGAGVVPVSGLGAEMKSPRQSADWARPAVLAEGGEKERPGQ